VSEAEPRRRDDISGGWPSASEAVPPGATAHSNRDSPRNRLAASTRRLLDVVVGRRLSNAEMSAAAEDVAAIADRLAALPGGKRPRRLPQAGDHPQDLFPSSPVIGFANPLAPPAELWAVFGEDGKYELRGKVRFGYPYEGPPTIVHGGVLAELLDEVLGAQTLIAGRPGMTGTLTVRYRRPTPLLADLDIESRVLKVEGRRTTTWGGVFFEGKLTVEAEGIFVAMAPQQMVEVAARNAAKVDGEVVDDQLAELTDQVDLPE